LTVELSDRLQNCLFARPLQLGGSLLMVMTVIPWKLKIDIVPVSGCGCGCIMPTDVAAATVPQTWSKTYESESESKSKRIWGPEWWPLSA